MGRLYIYYLHENPSKLTMHVGNIYQSHWVYGFFSKHGEFHHPETLIDLGTWSFRWTFFSPNKSHTVIPLEIAAWTIWQNGWALRGFYEATKFEKNGFNQSFPWWSFSDWCGGGFMAWNCSYMGSQNSWSPKVGWPRLWWSWWGLIFSANFEGGTLKTEFNGSIW